MVQDGSHEDKQPVYCTALRAPASCYLMYSAQAAGRHDVGTSRVDDHKSLDALQNHSVLASMSYTTSAFECHHKYIMYLDMMAKFRVTVSGYV